MTRLEGIATFYVLSWMYPLGMFEGMTRLEGIATLEFTEQLTGVVCLKE